MNIEWDLLYKIQDLHTPIGDKIMVCITTLGNSGIIWIVLAAMLVIVKKTRKVGIHLTVSLILTLLIGNIVLKNVVARPRPCWIDTTVPLLISLPRDYSFPSGHTFSSFASAMTLYLYNKAWGVAAFILASLIAFSRLYLFVHFPTDVLAGIVLGIVVAVGGSIFTNKIRKIKKEVYLKG